MPEKMGKYHVLGRIGRGGMGMIFKAHDPVLDRSVALKVISNDIEVTDELRARFYREAQACARLSHPNIVTVHDMGEDDGRLFIVMELLEGEELRRLFAPHKSLPLEDKLAIMSQVCDGLHYAHQKGIVHRDIKPGNIIVLPNGQVKILDFGIAQIATEGGMTRTGLIMGTLRYISPEQVRGRADHRSDIFSVGTVFYEFLCSQRAFPGDDPIELLEQLRTHEPPALDTVDPTIPADLAAILARAIRKEPSERFESLDEMRVAIEQVRRRIEEEAQLLRGRIRAHREQLRALQGALIERIGGGPGDDETVTAAVTDRARLATLQEHEHELARRIEAAQARVARAEAVAPAVQRGIALLEAGQWAEAVAELEAAVADVPEHARAREALERAREALQLEREALQRERERAEAERRQLTQALVRDARTALERGDFASGLQILDRTDVVPPPADLAPSIESLRRAAEARRAAHETAQRARRQAEESRHGMEDARAGAERRAPERFAPGPWADAEAKGAQAHAAFGREEYLEAGIAFNAATAAYRHVEEAARETERRQREAAEQVRGRMLQARPQAAGVERYAPDQWSAAEAKALDAESALAANEPDRAIDLFGEATELYRRAHDAAAAARERLRRRAGEARERFTRAQRDAEAVNAARDAATVWQQASERSTEAESARGREDYTSAAEAFDAAAALYRQAAADAQAARQRQRDEVERRRQAMAEARDAALAADVATHAPAEWQEAHSRAASGDDAFGREAYSEAGVAFDAAAAAYRRAEEAVRDARRRQREAAQQARGELERARAQAVGLERYAPDLSAEAEAAATEAETALSTGDLGRAIDVFAGAIELYRRARRSGESARERERGRAEELRELALRARHDAEALNAPRDAATPWHQASARSTAAESALRREAYAEAIQAFDAAVTLYRQSENEARTVRQRERDRADGRRQAMAEARSLAIAADAATHATAEWHEADSDTASGDEALAREEYAEAAGIYERSVTLYRRAEATARDVAQALAREAEATRQASGLSRRAAAAARAERYAPEAWRAGESAEEQASTAASREDHRSAQALFAEARGHYAAAAQAAGAALEAETRRLDALVEDARRLLRAGDLPASLARLNDALALRPGYEPAERVRSDAADQLRHIEAERKIAEATTREAQTDADAPTVRINLDEPTVVMPDVRSPTLPPATSERPEPAAPSPSRPAAPWRGRRVAVAIAALGAMPAVTVVVLYPRERAPVDRPPAQPAATTPARPEPDLPRAVQPPPGRDVAEDLRKRMIAARGEAAEAGAERLARASFTAASDKAREAEAAMGRQETTGAQERYNEAIAAFVQAKGEAIRTAAAARQEADVRAAESRAAEARRAAEVVDAPNLAKGPWTAAASSQRKADASLKEQAFDRARSLFGDAEKGFRSAAKAASDSAAASAAERERVAALKRALDEAEQSRRTAVQAREGAEQAEAPRLAARAFAAAQQKQAEGDAALNRQDSASAKLRFQEAQQAYRQAVQDAERGAAAETARVAAAQRQQGEAEQARERMTAARRTAEQAGAARYAPKSFASAQGKDREASAALGRADFSGAARLFGEARGDYQAAVQEARRESEREQRQVEQARAAMLARRDEALKGGADRLAKDAFAAAQARQAQADDLVARQNLGAAPQAYQDAADRYGDAGRQARAAQAKLDEPRPDAPPSPPKPAPEKQEARKIEPPPAPPRPAPEDEIRGVLASYVRGFETKDVALLQQVRPGLKPDEVKRLQESFEQSREYRVSVKVDALDVQGDQAVVKGRRTDTVVSRSGQSFRNDSPFTYRLKRAGPRWVIDAVN